MGTNKWAEGDDEVVEVVEDEDADDACEALDDAGDDLDEAGDDVGAAFDDAGDALSAAGDDIGAAFEDAGAAIAKAFTFQSDATMTWYQPAHAKAYVGLRRYGSGNWVQAYSVYPNTAEAEEGEE